MSTENEDFESDEFMTEAPEDAAVKTSVKPSKSKTNKKTSSDEHGVFTRLYRGETTFPFVARKKIWFVISIIVILTGVVSLSTRGLNLGIDFKGGTAWIIHDTKMSVSQAQSIASNAGLPQPTIEVIGSGSDRTLEIEGDLAKLSASSQTKISNTIESNLAKATNKPINTISSTSVGPTWGGQVTKKALYALVVFFILVATYISFRFEPKMAVAAFVALVHDIMVTLGVYSLAGFQVTPDTVIAILTILGYSLYDTVVVFDRVRDNTKGIGATGRLTYSEMIDLSMNQTLARSINTSLVAILPVLSVLVIGAEIFGATTLQYYGLALTVGLLSGAYSSIFIASPVLAILKEREPRYKTMRMRLENKGDRGGLLTPAAAAQLMAPQAGFGRPGSKGTAATGTLRPNSPQTVVAGAPRVARAPAGRPQGGAVKRPPTKKAKPKSKAKRRR